MRNRSHLGAALALAVAFGAAGASRLVGQGFGTGDQELNLGAAEFVPAEQNTAFEWDDIHGYLYNPGATTGTLWYAPFHLPDGSVITQICVYAYDANPGRVVNVNYVVSRIAYGGQGPGDVLPSAFNTDFDIGYGTTCGDPLEYAFHETADIDGDGLPDHLVHRIRVVIGGNDGGSNLGLGGVGITWHRQVSPAPGSASFNDVPTGHPFFQFIEALAASGITAGCGGGNYCPDAPLTRGQMAVFLSKALGLYWPY